MLTQAERNNVFMHTKTKIQMLPKCVRFCIEFLFQCAMEENCLASEAYRLRRENPNFSLETRRLMRFTTSIENIGDADFRPFIPKSAWQWHACHMHYHSMEVRKQLSSDYLLTNMYPPLHSFR